MKNYPTPHINATPEDFANTVIMPGDPLRAKFIAETFLTDARLVNNVRGIQGYTGVYEGVRVSVMASGMGVPSMGIYSYELFNFFGVENIIRVGSAGSLKDNVKVNDIVIADGFSTDSCYVHQDGEIDTDTIKADKTLLENCKKIAQENNLTYHIGKLFSSDVFYGDSLKKGKDALAVEMETAALYFNAKKAGKRALTVCTISDSLVSGESLSAEQRQTSFTQMIELALKTAVLMEK